jgi:hypothetical protein
MNFFQFLQNYNSTTSKKLFASFALTFAVIYDSIDLSQNNRIKVDKFSTKSSPQPLIVYKRKKQNSTWHVDYLISIERNPPDTFVDYLRAPLGNPSTRRIPSSKNPRILKRRQNENRTAIVHPFKAHRVYSHIISTIT